MLTHAPLMTFLATTDAVRSRKFYEEMLGLTFVEESPFSLVFDVHGTSLRLQKVERVVSPPYTLLGWQVSNLQKIVEDLAGRGVKFERFDGMEQDAFGIWTVPGGVAKVAWFQDPDGQRLSLTEEG